MKTFHTITKQLYETKLEMDKMKEFMKIQESKLEATTNEMKGMISIIKDQGTQLKENADEITEMSASMQQKDRVIIV